MPPFSVNTRAVRPVLFAPRECLAYCEAVLTDSSSKRVEFLFLGTGGAETTPRAGCLCHVCQEARRKGGRFVRNGPSLFLKGPSVLFDTPEDIGLSLEREKIHEYGTQVYP